MMVQRCCVPLCDTKVGDVDMNGAKVRFHRIPLIPEKILNWKNQMTNSGEYKPEPDLTINSRVCSKHFIRDDYITVEEQKPGTSGNHVLTGDAVPTVFKWNDHTGNLCELSRAVPYVKKRCGGEEEETLTKNQHVQCSIEEEKLREEIFRKNLVIGQLLQRLAELEGHQGGEKILNETVTSVTAREVRNGLEGGEVARKRRFEHEPILRDMPRSSEVDQEPRPKIQLCDQSPIDLTVK